MEAIHNFVECLNEYFTGEFIQPTFILHSNVHPCVVWQRSRLTDPYFSQDTTSQTTCMCHILDVLQRCASWTCCTVSTKCTHLWMRCFLQERSKTLRLGKCSHGCRCSRQSIEVAGKGHALFCGPWPASNVGGQELVANRGRLGPHHVVSRSSLDQKP